MIGTLQKLDTFIHKITGFNTSNHSSFKNPTFILLALIVFGAIFLAYSNHFSNAFQFDDAHTIENNKAIHEVTVKKFFTDGATFSSLPSNQSYRPYTTLENAIDYKVAGGLDSKMFHIHIFITFLIVCLLLLIFTKQLLDKIKYSHYNQYWGLLVAAIFGLLCANAETVNYIIQRGEITAGLFVLLGFVAFLQGGIWRKAGIYLLFPLIGFFAKEMAFVFSPLLLLYFLIFEEQVYLLQFYKVSEFKKCWKSFVKVLPAFIMTVGFYAFYTQLLPTTFSSGGFDQYKYLITQPMVMCHYIATFFYPYNLSADTDWTVFSSITDYRAIIGIVLVLGIAYLALRGSKQKETRVFSFGILWFFISLLPSSSFIPFAEVLNDHRSFIPYIGLTIAVVFGVKYLLDNYFTKAMKKKSTQSILLLLMTCFLFANAYGVRERNKVWKTGLSLWHDVTIKSPNNGRGLMNYGLALMEKGDYANAEISYNKALKLTPNYSVLYVNLGILKNEIGEKVAAESNFLKAIDSNNPSHVSLFFYGRFLLDEERVLEAKEYFTKSLAVSPNYPEAQRLLMKAHHKTNDWEKLKQLSESILQQSPNDLQAKMYLDFALHKKSVFNILEEEIALTPTPGKYLDLSLNYFQEGNYDKCIVSANKAIELKPNYPEAYNNIGIAFYHLKEYDLAIKAYQQALTLNPAYELARNNLANTLLIKEKTENGLLSADDYLNLSLAYYNEGKYEECIETAKQSIAVTPNANAYNNICTAYNQLKQYEEAIEACNEALKLEANHQLAKGNLDYAKSQLK